MRSVHKILLFLFAVLIANILPTFAEEQYVDPVFGDTINRSAEDFITVSLLVVLFLLVEELPLLEEEDGFLFTVALFFCSGSVSAS